MLVISKQMRLEAVSNSKLRRCNVELRYRRQEIPVLWLPTNIQFVMALAPVVLGFEVHHTKGRLVTIARRGPFSAV